MSFRRSGLLWNDYPPPFSVITSISGEFQVTVCGVTVCPFSRRKGNQRPKCLENKAQMHLSRNCPFSNKTNLHLELPRHNLIFLENSPLRIRGIKRCLTKAGGKSPILGFDAFFLEIYTSGSPAVRATPSSCPTAHFIGARRKRFRPILKPREI